MNINKVGHYIHTDKGWVEVPKPNIVYKGQTVKPENPMYSVISSFGKPKYEDNGDVYCSPKEYEEMTGQI